MIISNRMHTKKQIAPRSSEDISAFVSKILDEQQAETITILTVKNLTTITDYMIVCTGRSQRHLQSLAETLVSTSKVEKIAVRSVEGRRNSEWIVVDLYDVVVHLMLVQTRDFYRLEELWSS